MPNLVTCSVIACFFLGLWLLLTQWQPHVEMALQLGDACQGRRLYMHDLPDDFNEHIVKRACDQGPDGVEWICSTAVNQGRGLPARTDRKRLEAAGVRLPPEISTCKLVPEAAWFRTGQFGLELLVHSRMKRYQCRTANPEVAQLAYSPYYAGLDLWRYIFTSQVQMRDKLGQRLVGFLQARQRSGSSSPPLLLVLGRIVWDFVRNEDQAGGWGSSLLSMPVLSNATKLLLERPTGNGAKEHEMGVPYPTGFHPSSASQVDEWLSAVAAANPKRSMLASYAANGRPIGKPSSRLRAELRRQCEAGAEECTYLACDKVDCATNPETVSCLALSSIFCLMPPGDSPTRKGLFDSLLSGCIPVLFSTQSAYKQYLWHLPAIGSSYSILLPQDKVLDGSLDVLDYLAQIEPRRIRSMQAAIAQLVPGIVYANQSIPPYRDAFDLIMENVFRL